MATAPTDSALQPYDLPTTEFFAATPKINIAYARVKATKKDVPRNPVLLIVGFTGVKEDWHALPFHLSRVGHDVVVFDHRSLGESTAHDEQADGEYTLEQLADDAAALARHVFPEQQLHVMGISMGGMIAQLFASRHTSLVRSLILGCTTLSLAHPIDGPAATVTPPDPNAPPPATPAEMRALITQMLVRNYTPTWAAANPERVEFLVDQAMRWNRPPAGVTQQGGALVRFHGTPTVASLASLPVLIVHGTADAVIPVSQGRVLARHLPQAKLVELDGAGHLFSIQMEEESHKAIDEFIDANEKQ